MIDLILSSVRHDPLETLARACCMWVCPGLVLLIASPFIYQTVKLALTHPGYYFSRLRGGRPVSELARRLGMTPEQLRTFTPTYRTVQIPKRSGGSRTLHIPHPATKKLQRQILRSILKNLAVHPAAHAYQPGRSIVTNARLHTGRQYVVKFDLKDFFPATRADRIHKYFRRIGWSKRAAEIITRLTTHQNGLPQGAPTSPRLSNLVNRPLDAYLTKAAKSYRATYTRYADDITFSFNLRKPHRRGRALVRLRYRVLRAARWCGYQVHTGPRKLRVLEQHHRQTVTGLVVNEKVQLSRKQRRLLRAAEHRLATGQQPTLTPAQIQGWRSLQSMIDKQRHSTPEIPPNPKCPT